MGRFAAQVMEYVIYKLRNIIASNNGLICYIYQSVEKPGYASGIRRVWVM